MAVYPFDAETISMFLYYVMLPQLLKLASYVAIPLLLWKIAMYLWVLYVESGKDPEFDLPLPPGTMGLPLIGETLELIQKKFNFYRERRSKYGRIYKTHVLGQPTVRVFGSENLKRILKGEEIIVRLQVPSSVQSIFGEGALSMATRKLHAIRRQAAGKAFSPNMLKGYARTVQPMIRQTLQKWVAKGDIVALDECRKLAFDLAVRLLLGADYDDKLMKDMIESMNIMEANLFCLPINLPGFGYRKAMNARKKLLSCLKIIQERSGSNEETDVVSKKLLENTEIEWSHHEIQDTTVEMLFAAFQGVSSIMTSCLLQMFRHPELHEKLRTELTQKKLFNEESLSYDDVMSLDFLKKLSREMLRYGTPIGGGFRKVLKTFELEGYQIPRGWTILYSIRDNHETEENFEQAGQFNPERWDEESLNSDDHRFLSFGGTGTRSCTGEKYVMVVLHMFLCELAPLNWNIANPNPSITYLPVMVPEDGLPVHFLSK